MQRAKKKSTVVRISRGLHEAIIEFLELPSARRLGLGTYIDVVNYAVRDLLKRYKVIE